MRLPILFVALMSLVSAGNAANDEETIARGRELTKQFQACESEVVWTQMLLNSGNTSQPHLHFHVQNSPRSDEGDGLPAPFTNYVADGKPIDRGEPIRGQTVRPR
jgi:hypothetical protein